MTRSAHRAAQWLRHFVGLAWVAGLLALLGGVALPAVAAGAGLALSLPPWGFWILAFPAAGLLWWRLGGLRPRTRLWAGWLAGLGCYLPGLWFAGQVRKRVPLTA